MMATLQLTPAAAERLDTGPRFRSSRSLENNRRLVGKTIRQLKSSPEIAARYLGCILEAIQRLPKNLSPQKA